MAQRRDRDILGVVEDCEGEEVERKIKQKKREGVKHTEFDK